jgi:hypothetical protein
VRSFGECWSACPRTTALTTNAAVNETLERFLIPKMFAQVAQGKLSAAKSVHSTASEMKQIWAKWKAAGKV